jgi:monoterpene epsilon-lactone hydrolase
MRVPHFSYMVFAATWVFALMGGAMAAEPPRAVAASDGSLAIPAFTAPFSSYASPEARKRFAQMMEENRQSPGLGGSIDASRRFYDKINADRAVRMRKLYPVRVSSGTIGGIGVDIVEPASGEANAKRVLINLHGGGFLWGAHSGVLVEAIPVASLGKIKVIGVDYRQGPEHVFPAASDDVEAVYRALLKDHAAADIGIYGCSAGGVLTGEVVARLIRDGVKTPGAIGTFCGSVADMGGDSTYIGPALSGDPIASAPIRLGDLPYFKGAKVSDPMVFAGNSPAILAQFPPTLLISGTRDFAMSSVLQAQRLLTNAGVETELHVWDGMWHAFFSDPELPESKEAYAVMVRFFDRHLGARPAVR